MALGTWTAKDLPGHLGAFEARAADVLATFVGAAVLTDLMDADPSSFNDDQAAIRAEWPVAKVLDEYRSSYARVATHAARISAERWREIGTIPWYGDAYSWTTGGSTPSTGTSASTTPVSRPGEVDLIP